MGPIAEMEDRRTHSRAAAGGFHVAIIMDGSGRWATSRGLPRSEGHRAGVAAVRRLEEAASRHGITTLTLFAFSSGNWRRPKEEVDELLRIFRNFLRDGTAEWSRSGVRVQVIGRRDRLPADLREAIEGAEKGITAGTGLHLRFAVDYSAREAALIAARQACEGASTPQAPFGSDESLARLVSEVAGTFGAPEVDLLIRTGGEMRLSDCLLWESPYAELVFTDRLWPDFDSSDLTLAMLEFHSRSRRFGGVPGAA